MDAVRNLSVTQLKAALAAKGVTFPFKASKASLLELYQQECVRLKQPSAAIVPEHTMHDTRSAKNKRGSTSNAPQLPVKKGRPASKQFERYQLRAAAQSSRLFSRLRSNLAGLPRLSCQAHTDCLS